MPTLVVDNGAGILKAGLLPPGLDVTQRSLEVAPVRLPNCTAKSRAASGVEEATVPLNHGTAPE